MTEQDGIGEFGSVSAIMSDTIFLTKAFQLLAFSSNTPYTIICIVNSLLNTVIPDEFKQSYPLQYQKMVEELMDLLTQQLATYVSEANKLLSELN